MDTLLSCIQSIGFEDVGSCPASALRVDPHVRDMCNADQCRQYGTNWACPPACGDIETFQQIFQSYDHCILFQTVSKLDDEFDFEAMMAVSDIHKDRVFKLARALNSQPIPAQIFSAGSCTLCPSCTYPTDPCRLPEKRLVSMEAAGLNVTQCCKAANLSYNHGPNTITYTSCLLY